MGTPTRADLVTYVFLWISYNLLDLITTRVGLLKGYVESNPLPALVLQLGSHASFPIYKMGVALLWLAAVIWLARSWPRVWLALRLGNVLVFAVVFWNMFLIGWL
ncbi:MAG TPA: DUF5658 family protein [Ardenticatenaceae bacterium]|nr:DUF5658 family protein [Ardenticatenaceae bacterium]